MIEEFDKFLAENFVAPERIYVHPKIWSGYWGMKSVPRSIRGVCRLLGRRMKNKHIYWIGLPLYWVEGIKKYFLNDVNIELVDLDE